MGQTIHKPEYGLASSGDIGPRLVRGGASSGSSSKVEFTAKDTSDMTNPTREEIDAKLSATEARIEAAMAHMIAKVDHLPSTWVLVTTIFGGFVATIAAVIGLLSYGGDRFDSGAIITTQIMETRALADENARQIKDVSERLDALPGKLLDAIETRNRGDQVPGNGDAQ